MLFGVEGADRTQLRLVLAHELIHALQGQYLPLDSILNARENNDRLTAAQAILEGQATPGLARRARAGAGRWRRTRSSGSCTASRCGSSSPRCRSSAGRRSVLRESLIFPYLQGAEFMHWWDSRPGRDSLPYGPLMPVSTEQILHPERYARGDARSSSRFAPDSGVRRTRTCSARTRSG